MGQHGRWTAWDQVSKDDARLVVVSVFQQMDVPADNIHELGQKWSLKGWAVEEWAVATRLIERRNGGKDQKHHKYHNRRWARPRTHYLRWGNVNERISCMLTAIARSEWRLGIL